MATWTRARQLAVLSFESFNCFGDFVRLTPTRGEFIGSPSAACVSSTRNKGEGCWKGNASKAGVHQQSSHLVCLWWQGREFFPILRCAKGGGGRTLLHHQPFSRQVSSCGRPLLPKWWFLSRPTDREDCRNIGPIKPIDRQNPSVQNWGSLTVQGR